MQGKLVAMTMVEEREAGEEDVGVGALVAVEDVVVDFAGDRVLDHVGLTVSVGEIVTLIGRNGSGKTTLARTVLGLVKPKSGRVWRRRGLCIGYVPQALAPDPILPMTASRFLTLGGTADPERLNDVLDEVGMPDVADRQIVGLSGGELRRVMLARALLRDPELLVLDEPMSGIDVSGQVALYKLIGEIRDRHRCGVLLISHDLHLVMAETDQVVCLDRHVCCRGTPEVVVADPAFHTLFGPTLGDAVAIYRHEHDHRHTEAGAVAPLDEGREDTGHPGSSAGVAAAETSRS